MASPLPVLAKAVLLAASVLAATLEVPERVALEGRATVDDCFGPNGICTIWNHEFANPCFDALGSTNKNYTAWAVCKCQTGWLSMLQA
jgi:hypothetical protein